MPVSRCQRYRLLCTDIEKIFILRTASLFRKTGSRFSSAATGDGSKDPDFKGSTFPHDYRQGFFTGLWPIIECRSTGLKAHHQQRVEKHGFSTSCQQTTTGHDLS